ncbi:GerAB/ArcD/ProY family transporter [Piscibacillus salipiscarius]|uniref:GerAB/ArcD/ProY family transporter n=1 Tax=Piscibacillus salipiscarius TaxID=299480 RepID=UPI00243678F1|nr:GerAB/ArcD/ProY family transporter [Piscibacillus salipiscarius]
MGDLIVIHYDTFGKWIGGFFSLIWIIYFIGISILVLRSFIQVVQVWMFPDLNVIYLSIVYCILVYYVITGGFRVVAGVSFLGMVIPSYLILTILYLLEYTDFRNLLPVWNHSVQDLLIATKQMTFSYIGFATLLMFYPYIKDPEKSKIWAHGGNVITVGLYLILIVISLAYFAADHLTKLYWPTLTMWKTIEMPFVERFEYVGISSWGLVILPNICLSYWAASRGARQLFRISQRKALIIILLITVGANYLLKTQKQVEQITTYYSQFSFYLLLVYLPLLLIIVYFRFKRRKKS